MNARFVLVLSLGSLVGCGVSDATFVNEDNDLAETEAELRALTPAEVVGDLQEGVAQTIQHSGRPRYRALRIQARAFQPIKLVVASPRDAQAWLLSDTFRTLKSDTRTVGDARLEYLSGQDRTFYVAFREATGAATSFTVTWGALPGSPVSPTTFQEEMAHASGVNFAGRPCFATNGTAAYLAYVDPIDKSVIIASRESGTRERIRAAFEVSPWARFSVEEAKLDSAGSLRVIALQHFEGRQAVLVASGRAGAFQLTELPVPEAQCSGCRLRAAAFEGTTPVVLVDTINGTEYLRRIGSRWAGLPVPAVDSSFWSFLPDGRGRLALRFERQVMTFDLQANDWDVTQLPASDITHVAFSSDGALHTLAPRGVYRVTSDGTFWAMPTPPDSAWLTALQSLPSGAVVLTAIENDDVRRYQLQRGSFTPLPVLRTPAHVWSQELVTLDDLAQPVLLTNEKWVSWKMGTPTEWSFEQPGSPTLMQLTTDDTGRPAILTAESLQGARHLRVLARTSQHTWVTSPPLHQHDSLNPRPAKVAFGPDHRPRVLMNTARGVELATLTASSVWSRELVFPYEAPTLGLAVGRDGREHVFISSAGEVLALSRSSNWQPTRIPQMTMRVSSTLEVVTDANDQPVVAFDDGNQGVLVRLLAGNWVMASFGNRVVQLTLDERKNACLVTAGVEFNVDCVVGGQLRHSSVPRDGYDQLLGSGFDSRGRFVVALQDFTDRTNVRLVTTGNGSPLVEATTIAQTLSNNAKANLRFAVSPSGPSMFITERDYGGLSFLSR